MKYFLSVFLLTIAAFSQSVGQSTSAPIQLTGLGSQVTVRRDARSIPYIEAANDRDVYFAQGYTTASDRLWQMDLMRRLARGETAEIFGRSVLEEDKRWRRFNFASIAERSLEHLSPELRAALDSYARGVNAYIASLNETTTPVEFRILQYKPREWRATDTIVIGKILADALSTTWRNDLVRASLQGIDKTKFADLTNQVTPFDVILIGTDTRPAQSALPFGTPISDRILALADEAEKVRQSSLERVGLYAEDLAASNNWVISGKRTIDGKPILANDPHLAPTAPGIWYLAHLATPTMRVSGVTIPGVPGIILGHNADIAWGATNVGTDVQDLYVETFNDKNEYKTSTGWQTAVVRKETIKVRPNPLKADTEDVVYDVVETRNGPIILEDGGRKYSLKWTAFDPKNIEFEAFYRWNRAKNWDEFKSGLKTYGGSAQNFVYADVKGNIGWYAASRIPTRRVGDGALPYDGATNDGDWTAFIPFDELPNLYNPSSGLIVTANQRIVGTSYKYTQLSRDSAPPWRARRIQDLLEAKPKLSIDDVSAVQHDAYSIPHAILAKEIVQRNAAGPETIDLLKSWDGRFVVDSRAALVINDIRVCAGDRIAEVNKPMPGSIIRERVLERAIRENLTRWLPAGTAGFTDLLKTCDARNRETYADKRLFGGEGMTRLWGAGWRSRFPHPLAVAPLIGGQFATPNVPIDGGGTVPNVGSGVSMRHIASPGNWDATRHVIPLGQNGDPRSPHFKDQFEMWRTGTPAIFPFTQDAVKAAAKSTLVMTTR